MNQRDFWESGFRVIGLNGVRKGKCTCGNPDCKALYKHPIVSNWQYTPDWSEEQIETMEQMDQFATGYGVLVKGLLVIDVDARNGGVESYQRLIEQFPDITGAGMIVETGSGGGSKHLYYTAPEGLALLQHLPDYKGIDFKSSGFVVGPGSLHVSGNHYKCVYGSPSDIEAAPTALLDALRKPERHRAEYNGQTFDVSATELEDMLSYIDPDVAHEIWIKCGMAIHHATGGTGFAGWDTWSAKGAKYPSSDDLAKRWHSFGKSANPVTLGTLIYYADAAGWTRPMTFEPNDELQKAYDSSVKGSVKNTSWPEPDALPEGLHTVPPFDVTFLPENVGPWVHDIADRMQCPIDFVAIPVVVTLGALIGSKIGIKPEANTDWLEVPNLWGVIVGRPGTMKTPAINEALQPLYNLQKAAAKKNEKALHDYNLATKVYDKKRKLIEKDLDDAIENNGDVEAITKKLGELQELREPRARQYIATDVTYEKLGEIASKNPLGILVHRDELIGLISDLSKEENATARGFYLQAWSGTSPYVFERIIRGKIEIPNACVSLLGTTQPAKISHLVQSANSGGKQDDGLMQRFALMIWPDHSSAWKSADRHADTEAKEKAIKVFYDLDGIKSKDIITGEYSVDEAITFLRFDDEALAAFVNWRGALEKKLRSGELSPALESHFSKYRKLVPTIALINYLADGGRNAVDLTALKKAIAFSDYLAAHAVRCYGSGSNHIVATAKAVLRRIKKGDLTDGFTARNIYGSGWSGLTDPTTVKAALESLVDTNWLREKVNKSMTNGGRPKVTFEINPKALK
jgi:Protein of unknown function (DUF3987)/Bifunctional DNA primase/polymerase, N-terminal/Primase C terminal 2 (PriCT-2)